MKKILLFTLLLTLFLSGCVPSIAKQEEVIQENSKNEEKAIVPKYQISDSYYRTLTPFKPSGSRGTVVYNLNSRYDSDEFEEGLLRIAHNAFPTDEYIFQEGQYLDKETVTLWLNRKMTIQQLKARGLEEKDNIGLNPLVRNEQDEKELQENPIYLSHILEHNFLIKKDKKVKLAGISIGLALNSAYYYTTDQGEQVVEIKDSKIKEEGKKIAAEVVGRIRQIKGLENVPIIIGLYKQEKKTSVVPGNFFAYGIVHNGTSLDWKEVNEKYVLFPSKEAKEKHREDFKQFEEFQQDVSEYFPNYNGIVGRAFYINKELKKLSIDINIQFYGKTETIGFAQYVAGLIMKYFPEYWVIEIKVQSANGQEALILREPDMDEPFVHIY